MIGLLMSLLSFVCFVFSSLKLHQEYFLKRNLLTILEEDGFLSEANEYLLKETKYTIPLLVVLTILSSMMFLVFLKIEAVIR